jgi:GntR family transcriptional regulator / MocR family aminotransferase
MLENQTIEVPEVLLDWVGEAGKTPGVRQLSRALREAIRSVRLRPGVRLPASRALARQLGCSRWVVVQAYEQLTAEGYLESLVGSGTRVHGLPAPRTLTEETARELRSWRFDFRPGIPDLAQFPRAEWLRATRAALTAAPTVALDYGDPDGLRSVRESLADYLGRVRGVDASAADISVTTGSVNALALIARALRARGIYQIGVEDPGWIPLRGPFAGSGVEPVPIGVDEEGLVTDDLTRSGLRAVLVTPVHQFPVGTVMSPNRRRDLLRWAGRTGGLIVEDDYDSEYRYDRTPLGALQGISPDQVLLIGSVSKSLAPALRLGWMAAPATWRNLLDESRRGVGDVGVSFLVQLAFEEFLRSGAFEQHLRRMRKQYTRRRAALADSLARHFPGAQISGIAAGLHLMADLGTSVPAADIERVCDEHGIRLYTVQRYCAGPVPPGYSPATVVLGFGAIPDHKMDTAIATLARILRG